MLSVAVHKDISEYKPKIIGKLTSRTLVSIAGALGISILTGLYMNFVLGLNVGDYSIVIMAVSLPFWLCGFYTPKGMPFEKYFPLWIKFHFSDNKLYYTPTMILAGIVPSMRKRKKENVYGKQYRKLLARRGIEAYSPRAGRVDG